MSVVLPFPPTPVSKRAQNEFSQPAEIVIFPGVRVERRSFDLGSTLTSPRKRRVSQVAIEEDQLS